MGVVPPFARMIRETCGPCLSGLVFPVPPKSAPDRKNYSFRCNAYTTSVSEVTRFVLVEARLGKLTDRNAESSVPPERCFAGGTFVAYGKDRSATDNGDPRVQRRRGGGGPLPPAPRRSLRSQPRGPGRGAPWRRSPGGDGRGRLAGGGRHAVRRGGPGDRRPGPASGPRPRRGRLGPGASPARREPDPAADPDRGGVPTPHAGRSAPSRGAPAREANQPARAADHRPRPAPGDRTSMKRATIG